MSIAALGALVVALPLGQGLDIDFWYGPNQVFGAVGNPQAQINILGTAYAPAGLAELTYELDGGPALPLSFGPDTRRLLGPGDFNIELFLDDLAPGAHQVTVRAVDIEGGDCSRNLQFTVLPANVWPLPFAADWDTLDDVTDAAQPVDGHWSLVPGGVRCDDVGYDRLLAIGDTAWTNYEVTVPITIHDVDPNGYQFPSVTPGIGIIMRWNGHSDLLEPGSQPSIGYWPLGAAAEYVFHLEGCGARLQLYGNPFVLQDEDASCTQLEFDVPYIWKMRVQTHQNGNHAYKLKVWPQGTEEPAAWTLQMIEPPWQPGHGSMLLFTHHVDATFGKVEITPPVPATPPANDVVLVRQRADLFGHNQIRGKVIYREMMRSGQFVRRFNVTLQGAAPGQTLAVAVGGVVVGIAQANGGGEAVLEMRSPNFIDDPATQEPLPGNFPSLVDLDTVCVGVLAGVFFDALYTLPEGADLLGPQYKVSNQFIDGLTGLSGEVFYRERIKNGSLDRRLSVKVTGGEPGTFRWFRFADGEKIERIYFDANGVGALELRSPAFMKNPLVEIPMPDWFPTLVPGEVVRIGSIEIELTP